METITHAAILRSDGIIVTGKSHTECSLKSPSGTCRDGSVQGFVTSKDRFVTREEAHEIAFRSDQIPKDLGKRLFYEDIYHQDDWTYHEVKGYVQKTRILRK